MTVSPMARRRPVQRGTDRPGLDGEAHNRGRHRCEWSSSCPPEVIRAIVLEGSLYLV